MCRCGKIPILAWIVASTSLAALSPLATAARAAEEVAPTVRLDDATFFGVYNNITDTNRFAGIPFAKPPTGDLRFRLPIPNDPYALGVVNATTFGPSCTQDNAPYNIPDNLAPAAKAILESANSNLVDSEDCLTINVWQPDGVTKDSKLPVVAWIYGGGFTGGGTVSYDGSFIVQRSVALNQPIIYVSMNYRLAAFGFLGGAEVKEAGVANLGLQDQRQAFRWVRKYISAFGGDPDKVTIWGESAGAISVALHMIANGGDSEGLFRAGFMQSGSPIPFGTVEQGQQSYDHLVESVDCQNSTDSLQCLRAVPYEAFKAALNSSASNSSDSSWAPRADGRFLVDPPQRAVLKGTVANIPFVTGDCDDEGTLFVLSATNVTTNNDTRKYIANNYLPTAPLEDIDQLLVLYPDDVTQGSPFDTGNDNALTPEYKRLAAFHGDAIFVGPRRFFLQQRSDKQPTWSFLSKRSKSLPDLGSYHGHDLVNIYGDGELTDYLVNFVNRLDPNGNGTGLQAQWPRYTTSNPLLMTFLDGTIPQEITQDTFRKDAIGNVTEIFLKYPL